MLLAANFATRPMERSFDGRYVSSNEGRERTPVPGCFAYLRRRYSCDSPSSSVFGSTVSSEISACSINSLMILRW